MNIIKTISIYFMILYYKLAYNIAGIMDEEYYAETGRLWSELGNYKRAILNYEKALKTLDISGIRNCIAWCYLNLGAFEEANINYLKAYDKRKDVTFLIRSAYCKYLIGNKDEAIKLLEDIKANNHEDKTINEIIEVENCIKEYELKSHANRSLNSDKTAPSS